LNKTEPTSQPRSEKQNTVLEWAFRFSKILEKRSRTVSVAILIWFLGVLLATLLLWDVVMALLTEGTRETVERVLAAVVAGLFPLYAFYFFHALRKWTLAVGGHVESLDREKDGLKQQYDEFIEQHVAERSAYKDAMDQQLRSYEESIEKIKSAREVTTPIEGHEHINTELMILIQRCKEFLFYGDFTLEYADRFKNFLGNKLRTICDRLPLEQYPDDFFARCNYRYWHQGFEADLFVFEIDEEADVSLLIFRDRAFALRMNFRLDDYLNLKPDNFPILTMREQVNRQIKAFHNPLVRTDATIGSAELITEEFSFVLNSIKNGYFKPIAPPAHFDEWNKRIFDNFVDYATMKLDQAKELFITWKFDPKSTETLKYAYRFSSWIEKLNGGQKEIVRLILVRRSDLERIKEEFERVTDDQNPPKKFNSFNAIVEDVCNEVILKDITNPNYKVWYVNADAQDFPATLWKDFAVFIFDGRPYEIIQDSSYEDKTKVLKLFFRKVVAPSPFHDEFQKILDNGVLLKKTLMELMQ
jgi:hypothetical protein